MARTRQGTNTQDSGESSSMQTVRRPTQVDAPLPEIGETPVQEAEPMEVEETFDEGAQPRRIEEIFDEDDQNMDEEPMNPDYHIDIDMDEEDPVEEQPLTGRIKTGFRCMVMCDFKKERDDFLAGGGVAKFIESAGAAEVLETSKVKMRVARIVDELPDSVSAKFASIKRLVKLPPC